MVLLYYLVKDKFKFVAMFCFDVIFFALNGPEYIIIFLVLIIFNTTTGRILYKLKNDSKIRKPLFIIGVVVDAASLLLGKLSPLTILPIGLSFFVFKAISYLADVYMKRIELDGDQFRDLVYLSFFGQLQSGPISRYSDMAYKGRSLTLISGGVYRFLIGFSKKVLLADVLGKITKEIFRADFSTVNMSYAWLGAICWALELFYDFSGYSDMAIGVSNIFGFECPENFIYPYTTGSISKFWRKWHITLGAWFRDYVYIPLGGSRCEKKWRVFVNMFVVWMLTGFWHGSTLNFLLWGFLYFVLISFEKLTGLPDKLKAKPGKVIYRVFVLVCIVFLWVIFRCDSIPDAFEFIKHMVIPFAGLSEWNLRVVYLLRHYWLFIAAAVLFCTPVMPALGKLTDKTKILRVTKNILMPVAVIALFVVSVSFVISGINDPFAYGNF